MPRYRLGQAAKMLGVSVDTVRRMVDDGRLVAVRTSGGQRLIEGESLAVAVKPRARPAKTARQSARNRFPGIVRSVEADGVMALVEIEAGPHLVTAAITRDSVEELGLAPGVAATATVKATSVMVQRGAE